MNRPQCIYPLAYWWAFKLFPFFCYYKQYSNEHSSTWSRMSLEYIPMDRNESVDNLFLSLSLSHSLSLFLSLSLPILELKRLLTRGRERGETAQSVLASWADSLTYGRNRMLGTYSSQSGNKCHIVMTQAPRPLRVHWQEVHVYERKCHSPFFSTMKSQMSRSWERFPKTRTASRIPSMLLLMRSFKSTRLGDQSGWENQWIEALILRLLETNTITSTIIINADTANSKIKNDNKIQTSGDFSKN